MRGRCHNCGQEISRMSAVIDDNGTIQKYRYECLTCSLRLNTYVQLELDSFLR